MKTSGYRANQRKNHWRRWQWNRIVERLAMIGIKPRDAVVLYLAAEDDADRAEALRRGFSFHNLIAVDHSEAVVSKLRAEGKTAVCCELREAILAWPEANVVVADFCCGLHFEAVNFLRSVACAAGERVLSVNLLRGRDKLSGEVSKAIGETFHRGVGCVAIYSGLAADANEALKWMIPAYHSYNSGKTKFDSAVFLAAGGCRGIYPEQETVRKIAAAKAIRTQRLNGTLRRAA